LSSPGFSAVVMFIKVQTVEYTAGSLGLKAAGFGPGGTTHPGSMLLLLPLATAELQKIVIMKGVINNLKMIKGDGSNSKSFNVW